MLKLCRILSFAAFLTAGNCFGQGDANRLVDAASAWLKNISAGARAELLETTDERFLATTPAGDVLARERLVPVDTSQSVQRLPPLELDSPLARVVGETGVVVSKLKTTGGPALNATFVFSRQKSAWKLVALHLSPAGK